MNATQKARLQAAADRRIRAARLAHYQQQARIAQVPDYFEHVARSLGLPRTAQTFHVVRS